MDQFTTPNCDRTKHFLAIKLRIETKPLVYCGVIGPRTSHGLYIDPREAAKCAEWLLEPLSEGWGFEPGIIEGHKAPAIVQPADEVPDMRGEKARLVCYVLDVLVWKLPREYGPAWLAAELANKGIPVEWDSARECFTSKPSVEVLK